MTVAKHKIGLLASETPPHLQSLTDELLQLIPALREQHGTWFRVGEFSTKQSAHSARQRMKIHASKCEWVVRTVDGQVCLFGRWVGFEALSVPLPPDDPRREGRPRKVSLEEIPDES